MHTSLKGVEQLCSGLAEDTVFLLKETSTHIILANAQELPSFLWAKSLTEVCTSLRQALA